jgi:hypothetical protein
MPALRILIHNSVGYLFIYRQAQNSKLSVQAEKILYHSGKTTHRKVWDVLPVESVT